MSADAIMTTNEAGHVVIVPNKPAPKPQERGNIPRDVKTEIENLRRLVQTVHDRLHELAKK